MSPIRARRTHLLPPLRLRTRPFLRRTSWAAKQNKGLWGCQFLSRFYVFICYFFALLLFYFFPVSFFTWIVFIKLFVHRGHSVGTFQCTWCEGTGRRRARHLHGSKFTLEGSGISRLRTDVNDKDYLKRTGYSAFIFAEVPVKLWEISDSIRGCAGSVSRHV